MLKSSFQNRIPRPRCRQVLGLKPVQSQLLTTGSEPVRFKGSAQRNERGQEEQMENWKRKNWKRKIPLLILRLN